MNRLTGILSLILVVFLAVGSATAQAEDAAAEDKTQISGTWVNGVKGGASFATLGGETRGLMEELIRPEDGGTHLGANIGYFFSYRIGNGIAIQPEVFITEKGAPDAVFASGRNAAIITTYLELPVLGRYNLALAGDFKPYGYLGPVFSYNIDARRMVATTHGIDYEDQISDYDFGFAVGGGVDWNLGKKTGLTIDARFSMGLLNIIDDEDNDAREEPVDVKHRVFSVMFGIWK